MPPEPLRKSGIYALFRQDGGPLAEADCAALGLTAPLDRHGCWSEGHDGQSELAVSTHCASGSKTVLVGEVEEICELAQMLGMKTDSQVAAVAAAALARFDKDTPLHLIGEWSLLHRAADGTITAMLSAARRDPLLYAQRGAQLAFAPDLFRLCRLAWVDTEIDEFGLLSRMGRAAVRERRGNRTMVRGVRELQPGETLTVAPDGRQSTARCQPLRPQPRNPGSYADLVAQVDALLAAIMAERAARAPQSALLLSGGLDSSLLAAFAAAVPGGKPSAVCSVAPPDSGLPDEVVFAALAAEHLGLPFHRAAPPAAFDPYRPADYILSGANGPPLSNRQPLTEAFQQVAKATGATMLVNGTYGEMTATARLPQSGFYTRLRAQSAAAWHWLRPPGQAEIEAHPFHVRIAPQRLAALPEEIRSIASAPAAEPVWPPRDGVFGYLPGIEKALAQANEFYPGALRMDFPFRDLRLLRLFAGFPLETLRNGGHDRPVVRSLLDGRLPDAIRLRTRGMPASPDHLVRLQAKAAGARARIAAFRHADLDQWLDLDWLDAGLERIAARGASDLGAANQVQLTAIAAEFLLWWRTRR